MKIKLSILLLSFLLCNGYAQKIDSLLEIYHHSHYRAKNGVELKEKEHIKCGFSLAASIWFAAAESPRARMKAAAVLDRPNLPLSKVSPAKKFRVHYALNGADSIGYDIDDFLSAADSAYKVEVTEMGFPPPVKDNGQGGDTLYDVYIMNFEAYGETIPETEIGTGSHRYTTFIRVHNNFAGDGFNTHGINAAKVTIAHELNHAIQMSNYAMKNSNGDIEDRFFHELTSTSMEEFVFGYVNDYYSYLRWSDSFFNSPEMPFSSHSGYDLVVWNIYLRKKFGIQQILAQWNYFRNYRALKAMDLALRGSESCFALAYNDFANWCYYTGSRSIRGRYFDEASEYEMYKYTRGGQFNKPFVTDTVIVRPSSVVPVVYNYLGAPDDSIMIMLVNSDIDNAIANTSFYYSVPVSLSVNSMPDGVSIGDRYYVKVGGIGSNFTKPTYFFNNTPIEQNISFPFPNPLKLKKGSQAVVYLPLKRGDNASEADLYVYDTSMKLVHSGRKSVVTGLMVWEPSRENNGSIGTGIYFYIVKTTQNSINGKIAVINE